MRKYLSFFVAAILAVSGFSTQIFGNDAATREAEPLHIVTTIFPEYDWVRNILGENPAGAEVEMLLDSGVDLHSFQPTAEDILKISTCDLFVYVGGESDEWVEDALKEATNPDMLVINLLEALGGRVKEEEIVEGMEAEEHDHGGNDEDEHDEDSHDEDEHDETEHDGDSHVEDEHDEDGHVEDEHGEDGHDEAEHGEDGHDEAEHDADSHVEDGHDEDEHDHGDEPEYDEHVWLSLRNAAVLCDVITDAVVLLDPENADYYAESTAAYKDSLSELDSEYENAVSQASVKTLLFGDRFPFRYLVDDYGLNYYAAFVGCSAETEASFETITFLANKVDELGLHSVMTIEGTDHRIAETIVQNTAEKNQQILTMDSMQSTTARDVENGVTYLSTMESNLEVLTEALK